MRSVHSLNAKKYSSQPSSLIGNVQGKARQSVDQPINGRSGRASENNVIDINKHIDLDNVMIKDKKESFGLAGDETKLV
jgi:hypothetical protein